MSVRVDDEELTEEFQRNHDNWDFENAEVHEPAKNVASVYSVRFERDHIRAVRAAAKAADMTTSEFIRNAAIAAAKGESAAVVQASLAELRGAIAHAESALKAIEAAQSAPGERLAG